MALTPRTKKYTDYAYLITNPASENDVRSQMDGAVDEVFTTVDSAITTIESTLTTTTNNIGNLASLTTTVKTSIVNAINELVTNIGTLASLTTTAKTNLVVAINELVSGKANKAYGEEFSLTLLASWTGNIYYRKNDLGQVYIRSASLVTGTATNATQIATLPEGFRPQTALMVKGYNTTTGFGVDFQIATSGGIYVRQSSGLTTGNGMAINHLFQLEV